MNRRNFLRSISALGVSGLPCVLQAFGKSKPRYQLGCFTRPWDQFEYRVALDGIAESGFSFVGLMTAKGKSRTIVSVDSTPEEVRMIAGEIQKRGLKTLCLFGGDLPVEHSVNAGIAGLKKLIDYCALCECPHLMLVGTEQKTLVDPYYKVVAECCAHAAEKNVCMSIKPHGDLNATGQQCKKIVEQIKHKNFRLWYDPGNVFYYSDGKVDPVDDCESLGRLVVGMSIKDFNPPKDILVTPGTGRVNFRKLLSRLSHNGFHSGPLIVECVAPGNDPARIVAEAKKARRYLEEVTSQLA